MKVLKVLLVLASLLLVMGCGDLESGAERVEVLFKASTENDLELGLNFALQSDDGKYFKQFQLDETDTIGRAVKILKLEEDKYVLKWTVNDVAAGDAQSVEVMDEFVVDGNGTITITEDEAIFE